MLKKAETQYNAHRPNTDFDGIQIFVNEEGALIFNE